MTHRLAGISKPTAVVLLAAVILASFGLVSPRFGGANDDRMTASTDYQIAFWANRVEEQDLDYLSRTNLAAAHLAAGRETGEFHHYESAEPPLREALELNNRYGPTLATLAEVNLARHEFGEALKTAQLALTHDPGSVQALTIVGDAQLELGRYDQAAATYQTLSERRPGAESEARLARLAFVTGDPAAAIAKSQRAIELAGSTPDPSYFSALVAYAVDSGHIELARETAVQAQSLYPTSGPAAESIALVLAQEGDLEGAATVLEELLVDASDPGVHEALGDIYNRLGDSETARIHYEQFEPAAKAITTRPAVFDREIAMFLADTGQDSERAVALARRDLENRQDIYAYDTLAWAYYANGDFGDASAAMSRALEENTIDPHLYYRAGVIAWANGDLAGSRELLEQALAINPDFDVAYTPHAERLIAEMATS